MKHNIKNFFFFSKRKQKESKSEMTRGLSLIEMVIAVSIFSVVMVIVSGSLIVVIEASRKARAQKLVIDNLNGAVENMVRHIREGTVYDPVGSIITFEPEGGDTGNPADDVIYELFNGQIRRSLDNGTNFVNVTADNITIDYLAFDFVSYGAFAEQDKISIRVAGNAEVGAPNPITFEIQTTASQRLEPTFIFQLIDPSTASNLSQNPICDIQEAPGRIIIDFEAIKTGDTVMLSTGVNQQRGPFTLALPIPPGDYEVYIQSWDNHCEVDGGGNPINCHTQTQDGEGYFITLEDSGGTEIYNSNTSPTGVNVNYGGVFDISGASPDIPQTVNTVLPPALVDTNGTVSGSNDAVTARTFHACSLLYTTCPSPPIDQFNSIIPVCAAFDSLGGAGAGSGDSEIREF